MRVVAFLVTATWSTVALAQVGPGPTPPGILDNLAIGGAILGTNKLAVIGSTGNLGYFLQYPSNTTQAQYQNLRLDRHSVYSGGSAAVVQSLWSYTTTSPNGAFYEWPITSQLQNHTLGSTGAQNVALNGTAFKQVFSVAVSISNASPAVVSSTDYIRVTTNNIIKFTTTGTLPSPLVVDTQYYVLSTGLTVSSFRISASQGGAAINTTTAGSGVHTFTVQGQLGPTWGGNFVCDDRTGTVDSAYSCVGAEINNYIISGAGSDVNRQRVGLDIVTGVPGGGASSDHVGIGLRLGPIGSTTLDRGIHFSMVGGTITTGIDFSEIIFPTAAILGDANVQTAFAWKSVSGDFDGTHGAKIFAALDDNFYIDNYTNSITSLRGANGAARLALSSTAITTPLSFTSTAPVTGSRLGVGTVTTWVNNQTCVAGQMMVDADFIYVCTATNTVKRAALSAF